MTSSGVFGWDDFGVAPLWVAGREFGAVGDVRLTVDRAPAVPGLRTAGGFVRQRSLADLAAPSGAAGGEAVTVDFDPFLDDAVWRALEASFDGFDAALAWLPWPLAERFAIRSDGRTDWTLSGDISGSAGVRGLHVVPVVHVFGADGTVTHTTRAADYPSATALTIVAASPATNEIAIPSTTDVSTIETGQDFSAQSGGYLAVHYYGVHRWFAGSVTHELEEANRLVSAFELVRAAAPRDYAGDVS